MFERFLVGRKQRIYFITMGVYSFINSLNAIKLKRVGETKFNLEIYTPALQMYIKEKHMSIWISGIRNQPDIRNAAKYDNQFHELASMS